jgi:hypothetical protein
MTTHAVAPRIQVRLVSRGGATVSLVCVAMILMIVGVALPWLFVFNGLTAVPGFSLDGGYLAAMMVAIVGMLWVAASRGGARILRPLALVAAAAVLADSLYSAWRITTYVAHPGITAELTLPSAGSGPYVLAAGAAFLIAATLASPSRVAPLARQTVIRLFLSLVLLTAAAIHLILSPQHFGESPLLGAGFLVAGIVQLVAAAVVLTRSDGQGLNPILLVSVALIAIYVYAVLIGLPLDSGHDTGGAAGLRIGAGEPLDLKGLINAIAEIAAIPLALFLARSTSAIRE